MPNRKVPDFKSDIPAHLLENVSPQDRWMMENISVLSQKSDWLGGEQMRQSENLDNLSQEVVQLKNESAEIKVQTTKTNGRVTEAEKDIKYLKNEYDNLKWARNLVKNKWFWLFVGAVVFFVYPFILTIEYPALKEFIKILPF